MHLYRLRRVNWPWDENACWPRLRAFGSVCLIALSPRQNDQGDKT